jgi:hypothetical protein
MPRRELKSRKQVADLLVPKLKRNEPRDRAHADWAKRIGLPG